MMGVALASHVHYAKRRRLHAGYTGMYAIGSSRMCLTIARWACCVGRRLLGLDGFE